MSRRSTGPAAARKALQLAAEANKDEITIVPAGKYRTPKHAEPESAPPDKRYVGPGRVQLEWVGDRSPFADLRLAMAVQLGEVDATIAAAWRELNHKLMFSTRIPGVFHKSMTVERDGMSEDITWGPHPSAYVQSVTYHDADRILSGPDGHEFLIHGYEGEQPADWDPCKRFLAPYVAPEVVERVRSIVIKEGAPTPIRAAMVLPSRG